ncbi:MAG: rhodanese-like domain-containing protein [Panacagrimonas sp.]
MQHLTPADFKQLIEQSGVQLLDVRTTDEVQTATIGGAQHIPLDQLGQRVGELAAQQTVAVYCHHGVRSERAGRILEKAGFDKVAHLAGGIDAWSDQIDPNIPKY